MNSSSRSQSSGWPDPILEDLPATWCFCDREATSAAASRHGDVPGRMLPRLLDWCEAHAMLLADAQAAVGVRDEVLATVAHDLKTPLQTIASAIELLDSDTVGERRRTKAIKALRRAHAEAHHLVSDLLETMRARSGGRQLDRIEIDVRALLDDLEILHRTTAEAKGVQLRVHRPPHPLMMRGDARRVLQLLGNLVSNAIAHTPVGGMVDVHADRGPEGIELRIVDDGPGIPESRRARVFEPFWQATPEAGGTGLGLSIARKLADAHAARLWVDNVEGRGAVFGVVFPTASA